MGNKRPFRNELNDIISEQQNEIYRLVDENNHLRKASKEQRILNGRLRDENKELTQKVRAYDVDY